MRKSKKKLKNLYESLCFLLFQSPPRPYPSRQLSPRLLLKWTEACRLQKKFLAVPKSGT